MSLSIDVARVREVLLPDGKWHQVADNSFEMVPYEFSRSAESTVGAGDQGTLLACGQEHLVPSTAARWMDRDNYGHERIVSCPVTSIQAVSYGWSSASATKK